MAYEKPEVVVLADATASIQGHKGDSMLADGPSTFTVGNAYDADE